MARVHANGIDIEYESFGRESDPAILLIMGFAAQMTMWQQALCEQLAAKGFRVIRFDNRDIGLSTHLSHLPAPNPGEVMARRTSGQKVEVPYRLDDMAADAAALLNALGIQSAHIVGASMGGMIAQLVAINHPDVTKSLLSIMSTTGRPDLPPAKPEAMAALVTPPASDSRADRIAQGLVVVKTLGSPGYPGTEEELLAAVSAAVDRAPYDPAGVARQMGAIVAAPARNEALKALRCPAMVLHGAEDPIIPVEAGKDTAASIPGCQLVIVPGMAHDFTKAILPVYLKHIGDFVAGVEAKKAA
ncbi:MAG TPA: alpha/beta hydrolase [Rhizomicrobium sp.]|jgi:pimeloyl-ACP methyl ester carboxylesterase|nr:alpha/beta hydrolase [Rhizomicrobium sp.]